MRTDHRAKTRQLIRWAASLALAVAAGATWWPSPALAEEPAVVRGVRWDRPQAAYLVDGSGPLMPRVMRLEAPPRFVIDLRNTTLAATSLRIPGVPGRGVTRVRLGQLDASTVRIVLDLVQAIDPLVEPTRDGLRIALDTHVAAPVLDLPAAPSHLRGLRRLGPDGFLLSMSRRRPYWSHVWPIGGDRSRLRLIFPATRLAANALGSVEIQSAGIERIALTQAGTDARVDVTFQGPPSVHVVPHAEGWLLKPLLGRKPEEPANARNEGAAQRGGAAREGAPLRPPAEALLSRTSLETPAPRRTELGSLPPLPGISEMDPKAPLMLRKVGEEWLLTLTSGSRLRYRLRASGEDRLYLTLKGGRIALPRDSVYIDNGLIARVRHRAVGPEESQLTIDLDQPVRFQTRLSAGETRLTLALQRTGKERVTLDPGHGGTDHGASGAKGTREKDVTLAVASKVAQRLETLGISVQMTRLRDVEILLRPRVEMANRNDSNVYVSIHANSFGSQTGVNGIETYYFNDASYPLAQSIHRSLVKTLQRPDRGVRKNNFYVVHHTRMPAALVEIGYLTNPQEEALLRDPAYQEKAAMAISSGIKAFVDSRGKTH
ncbi:MAG: N-acetylmuramoyl-L-alanine amidase [Candidatus Sericytochromatia bacterium]|nr:N-acetylmuramoyl-L-alanine amidase [Candidatus Sericytochromatia bacterium]